MLRVILISQRRLKKDKRDKDILQAHEILKLCLEKYTEKIFLKIWEDFKPKWRKIILEQLTIEEIKTILK